MPEPTEKDRFGAKALCGCPQCAFYGSGPGDGCGRHDRIARALSAAREEGRRAGLERAALLLRKWKHAENVREQIGNHDEEVAGAIAWIAVVAEADIRALIGGGP